ncbi:mitochondrial intermembrane space import and assembly protein 40-B [Nilaparvata lugens]|uniref:mitochondrial intermembrane space import and assembly protein 40-B n=1 Tax=Nilaparvata lugens TaxID=108931 RepID=UPI000B994F8E|nr:mitochondrial intermembrane space import and assembly protein 40-B [Nilaparvata lugens]XP_022199843.1 mitochondrial intermembrane space import and assembly protein 40-B [Nilaparvata lugens]XP_039282884.1 mitochondrial intermembrane space import and assembly protein 40-B [Nilaparvata lugens]
MSYCKREGKDVIIFATEEDHAIPSTVTLPDPEPQPGLILADGSINWNCPCLGGMATGPCGVQFREAFSCFHYSKEEPKGSECFDAFRQMQDCMVKYPALYNSPDDDDDASELGPEFDIKSGVENLSSESALATDDQTLQARPNSKESDEKK